MLVAPQVKIKASPPARITGGRELGTLDKRAKADIKGDGRRNMIGIPDIGLVAFTINLGAVSTEMHQNRTEVNLWMKRACSILWKEEMVVYIHLQQTLICCH